MLMTFVHRGDPEEYDFDLDDLTTNDTWNVTYLGA